MRLFASHSLLGLDCEAYRCLHPTLAMTQGAWSPGDDVSELFNHTLATMMDWNGTSIKKIYDISSKQKHEDGTKSKENGKTL